MDKLMRDERAAAAVGLNGATVARLWKGFQDGQSGLYWSRVWAIYILLSWCKTHDVFLPA